MKSICLVLVLCGFTPFARAEGGAAKWEVDPGHASIIFKINHLGFSNVYGMVLGLEGKAMLDDAHPEKSVFEVKAPTAKIFTANEKRDEHLHGPDFFNAKQFPFIELKSKSVKKSKDNKFDINGELTMHGVTKPVAFTIQRSKTDKDPWGNMRTGGETTLKIKRTDYGVSFMSKPGEVGDEVEITVAFEAVKK